MQVGLLTPNTVNFVREGGDGLLVLVLWGFRPTRGRRQGPCQGLYVVLRTVFAVYRLRTRMPYTGYVLAIPQARNPKGACYGKAAKATHATRNPAASGAHRGAAWRASH